MKDYIITLACISVFCGIVQILSPSGDGDGIKKNVRLISALCVLCVAAFPIGDFLIQLRDAELDISDYITKEELDAEYEKLFYEAMVDFSNESVAQRCKKILMSEFDMQEDELDIILFSCVENDNIKIQRADIVIYFGGITQKPEPLRDTIESLLGCECRIIYK